MAKKFCRVVAPLALLLLAQEALAADNGELRVISRILPGTCTMTLSIPNVSYHTLPLDRLNAAANTAVTPSMAGTKPRTVLNIACDAPAHLAMTVADNRTGSVANSVLDVLPSTTAADLFGLGTDSANTAIGAFALSTPSVTVNGAAGKTLESADGVTWNDAASGQVKNTPNWHMSWTSAIGTTPEAINAITQTLELSAAVVPTNTLETSAPVPLDGSVTMELVYL
jgi:hypothetical protein